MVVFGFPIGLYANAHRRLIDYRLGANLLVVTIPTRQTGSVLKYPRLEVYSNRNGTDQFV
jgi:hypothetical protein